MKKTQTNFQIDSEHEPASLQNVLEQLFFRRKTLAVEAVKFLTVVRDTTFERNNWKDFLKKEYPEQAKRKDGFQVLENRYFLILSRLRASGIVYSKNNQYHIGEAFPEYLKQSARIFENWKKQAKEGD